MQITANNFDDLKKIPFLEDGASTKDGDSFQSSFIKLLQKYDSIVFYDTETTGLNAQGLDALNQIQQIIELAAIRFELKDGTPTPSKWMDEFIKVNNDGHLPPFIVEFNKEKNTGITDELIRREGIPEKDAAAMFADIIDGNSLLIAYNAQFDINFISEMMKRNALENHANIMEEKDHLDALTVYRDRVPFNQTNRYDGSFIPPNIVKKGQRLENAIVYYSIDKYTTNSHRAIDDVKALYATFRKMDEQRQDLCDYINKFGFNPKYGLTGVENPRITYCAQKSPGPKDIFPSPKESCLPQIINDVKNKCHKNMSTQEFANKIFELSSDFLQELIKAEEDSHNALYYAKVNKKDFMIPALQDKLVSKEQYSQMVNFCENKCDSIYAAQNLTLGNQEFRKELSTFLNEIQSIIWLSPSLRYTGRALDDFLQKNYPEIPVDYKKNKPFVQNSLGQKNEFKAKGIQQTEAKPMRKIDVNQLLR